MFSASISGIGFVLLGINTSVVLAIIAIFIVAGFGLSRFVLVSNYMQKHIESHNRATVISVVAATRKIMAAITYPVVGLLVEWSLNYFLIILGCALIIFALIPKIKESYLID